MRTRTRFLLDIALTIGLVAAYKPEWTGISFHQWLSIAIIAPLLLHLVVNWEWALRVLRTFVQRLLSTSRLNFLIDSALLVSTVAVMLSGFMVSPAIIAPLGIKPTNPLAWHVTHSWSANATIVLFAIHALLHWRWFLSAAKRFAQPAVAISGRSRGGLGVAAVSGASVAAPRSTSASETPRRSRVGSRAAQAAAERATAFRTASVLALTGVLGLAIFVSVGVASPLLGSSSKSGGVAAAGSMVCPQTGCTASKCHATYGKSAASFYGTKKKSTAKRPVARKAKSRTVAHATATKTASSAHVTSSATTSKKTAAAKPKVRVAATPKPAAKPAPKPTPKKRMTCPATGCSASSCHATHGQSASSYYK
jgi:hypothetical protein